MVWGPNRSMSSGTRRVINLFNGFEPALHAAAPLLDFLLPLKKGDHLLMVADPLGWRRPYRRRLRFSDWL